MVPDVDLENTYREVPIWLLAGVEFRFHSVSNLLLGTNGLPGLFSFLKAIILYGEDQKSQVNSNAGEKTFF